MHRRVTQQEPNLFSDPVWLSFFCFSATYDNSGNWHQHLHALDTATNWPSMIFFMFDLFCKWVNEPGFNLFCDLKWAVVCDDRSTSRFIEWLLLSKVDLSPHISLRLVFTDARYLTVVTYLSIATSIKIIFSFTMSKISGKLRLVCLRNFF